ANDFLEVGVRQTGGGAVELRSISAPDTVTTSSGRSPAFTASISSSTARATVAAIGWSTAVSAGREKRTIGVLSQLMSDRSRGTLKPALRTASSEASVI